MSDPTKQGIENFTYTYKGVPWCNVPGEESVTENPLDFVDRGDNWYTISDSGVVVNTKVIFMWI